MTVQILERDFPTDHLPLLRWLMFTGVCAFGFVLAWYYGLFHLMLASDKTYISAIIVRALCRRLAALPRAHGRDLARTRQRAPGRRAGEPAASAASRSSARTSSPTDGDALPPGPVTDHIRNLILKARAAGQAPARPDAAAARPRRRAARAQPARLVRQRRADEARPARHHRRLHPDAGADRRPRRRRPRLGEELHGPDERRHGGGDVHDADRPDRIDPGADAVLSCSTRRRRSCSRSPPT